MVKINDTSTFPNTTPAPTDHVIGTDVSDTGNSSDGEVVTFLLSDIANLNLRSSWHPYDLTSPTGSETGTIYDFSVNGSVGDVESPTFEDGYEYAFVFNQVGYSGIGTQNLQMALYRDTDSAYFPYQAIASGVTTTVNPTGIIRIPYPRLAKIRHNAIWETDYGDNGFSYSSDISFVDSTVQTTSKAKFAWSSGNIDSGTIQMLRRREFLTG